MTDRHDAEAWIGPVGEACPIPAPGWEDHEPCGCLQALGARPADRDARRSYDRAAAALRAALELPDPRRPEVDLPAPV